jgi:predicted DNA-binding transcriptional regulator AlpA
VAQLLSINEVLAVTQIPRRTFFRMRADGRFPEPVKLGKFVAWRDDVIFHWLRDHYGQEAHST